MQYSYILNRSAKRKSISVTIKNGEVIVSAPLFAKESDINKLLEKHKDWISKKLNDPRKNVNFDLSKDQFVYVLGNRYPIKLVTETKNNIYIKDGFLYLEGRSINSITNHLKEYLVEIVEFYVRNIKEELGIDFIIQYKFFRTKWGCCYKTERRIVLNYLLGCLPKEVIRQVIFHEIAHFKVSNHQKQFYNHLATLYPDYKSQVKILKTFCIQ